MVGNAVARRGVSIALACRTFGVSEACYRYGPKLPAENEEIADLLVGLIDARTTWGFGLCFLHLRNVKGQAQRGWGEKQRRGRGITVPRQNVDDDRGGMNTLLKSFSAGGLDGRQAIIGHAAEDLGRLAVTVVAALQLSADPGQGGWQHPVPEGGAIAQGAGFASQNRDIVPRVGFVA
jgi:hypothetical protein